MVENMILAVINIYKPGKYLNYINKNLKILSNNNIDIFLSINDSEDYEDKLYSSSHIKFVSKHFQNIMPAVGFNEGITYGIEHNYDFCYFIDQDSLINSGTLKTLEEVVEREKNFSFLASKVVSEEDGSNLRYFRGILNKSMTFHSVKPRDYQNMISINAAGYTGILVNLDLIKEQKIYIDESYQIELDDYDFTLRLAKVLPGYMVCKSEITHPNKKDSRNNWLGETLDAYLQLFFMKRVGRDYLHIQNYRKLINRYGWGAFSIFKKKLMKNNKIDSILIRIKGAVR